MSNSSNGVRIGIVGLGGMGSTHARNFTDLGHDVVAGADIVPKVRDAFAGQFGVPTYEAFEAMYEQEPLDAVVITTPNKFHEAAAVHALEHGYDVLCEKPLAHTLESAERIADAAAAADAFCMVGFHNRFTTPVTLFKDLQDEGRFGDVTHVEAKYIRRRGIPGVGSWFTNRELSGGGALIDIGVHALDLAMYVLGFPEVEEVMGVTRSNFGTREVYADPDGWAGHWSADDDTFDVDDSVTAMLRCADGTTVSLDVAWAAEQEPAAEFTVRGTEAGANFSLHDETLTVLDTEKLSADAYSDIELTGSLDPAGHEAEDELFAEAVATGEAPAVNTVEQGLAVQQVIDAIYRSSDDGDAKKLDA